MPMSKISRFTSKAVTLGKNAVGGRGEAAAPKGGGGFADYAVVSLHCLRIYLEKPYRETLDLLSEMPHILAEIGLEADDLPDHSTLVKAFDSFEMKIWRVLLRLSSELHDTADHAAMDATFFDRETASKHYCRRTNYRVQTLKTTALVDTKHKLCLTFTVRPRNVMTRRSAGNSPSATRARLSASPPTKAMIGCDYARNCAKKV